MRHRRNRKSITVITPQSSATALISTSDMKSFLRVDTSDDDTIIAGFVSSATESIAQYLRRSINTQTLRLTMDNFGLDYSLDNSISEGVHELPKYFGYGNADAIDLPFPVIASITSITTYSRNNTSSVLSSAAYTLDTAGRIYLNDGYNWPVDLRDENAVVIQYVAGWGYTAVPLPIKDAIKFYAASMYDCRRMCEMSQEVQDMIGPWRILDPMGLW